MDMATLHDLPWRADIEFQHIICRVGCVPNCIGAIAMNSPSPSRSVWTAIGRGARGRCPSCGGTKLFHQFLKPIAECTHCGQDWTHQQADDFPAYVSIFLTGHLLAPPVVLLVKTVDLSVGALLALILPAAITMTLGLLQPAKGTIIAIQWWFGLHGFQSRKDFGSD